MNTKKQNTNKKNDKTKSKSKVPKMLTKTKVKELGFTEKMIKELLPEPLKKRNPRGASYAPILLWEEKVILRKMKTKRYLAMSEEADKRRAAASKGVDTKYEKTMKIVRELIDDMDFFQKSLDEIYEEAIEHVYLRKQDYAINHGFDYDDIECFESADQKTKNRWAVNYIRHELTDYDYILDEIKGKVGTESAYDYLYHAVMEKIMTTYPELASEVKKQMKDKSATLYIY